MEAIATEQRRYKRVPLILDVKWESLSGKNNARTADISMGGCYIETLGQVTPGEEIHFEIQLMTGCWMRLRGEVAYLLPNMGFGVRFTDIPERERNLLTQLIDGAN